MYFFIKARDKTQDIFTLLKDVLTSYTHYNNTHCYTLVGSASVQYLTWFKKYWMPKKSNCTIFTNSSQKYQVMRLWVNLSY